MSQHIPSLYGLVLAGGYSRRMGRDKATLLYRGMHQVDRALRMVRFHCETAFVSLRPDQQNVSEAEAITDRYGAVGPLGGILSAFYHHRDKDWLVMACDMPFIDLSALALLIRERDPTCMATAFRNPDGTANPYCTLYENTHKDKLLQAAKNGVFSPAEILSQHEVRLLETPTPGMLDRVGTPDEYRDAQKRIIGA